MLPSVVAARFCEKTRELLCRFAAPMKHADHPEVCHAKRLRVSHVVCIMLSWRSDADGPYHGATREPRSSPLEGASGALVTPKSRIASIAILAQARSMLQALKTWRHTTRFWRANAFEAVRCEGNVGRDEETLRTTMWGTCGSVVF